MSRSQFASAHPQPQPVITVNSGGGSLGSGGTLWFAIQARCRGGWTVPSPLVQATYSAGDSISIQVPSGARAAGDDIRRWEILAAAANNATQLKSLAWIEGYELDEMTAVSLPASITLATDPQIALAASVADPASLPTGSDRVHGQVREVASLAKFFRYNVRSTKVADGSTVLSADTGRWEQVGNNSTYLAGQTGAGGCDRDVRLVSESDVLIPEYAGDGSLGLPIKLVWYHDEGTSSPLPQGTRFGLSVLVNGANKSNLFRNKLKLTFRGFVDLSTGVIDTSDGASGTMAGVDEEVDFFPQKTDLLLQKGLPQGQGYLVEVRPQFNLWELNGQVGINSPVSIFLFPYAQAGNYSEVGGLFGNVVYPSGDRLLVVPGGPLAANILGGGAMVDSYSFFGSEAQIVTGLAANTGSQQITINGDGNGFRRVGTIPTSEALRALVSTESGQGVPSVASAGAVISGSSGSLSVEVGYPSTAGGVGTIRGDYPDGQVAGKTADDVSFNPPVLYLFASDGSEIRRFTANVVPGESQIVSITNWAAGTVVGSVPGASDPYQGLFKPDTPSVTPSESGGNLAAATYTVQAAFYWDGNQLSRVNHSAPGAMAIQGTIPSGAAPPTGSPPSTIGEQFLSLQSGSERLYVGVDVSGVTGFNGWAYTALTLS